MRNWSFRDGSREIEATGRQVRRVRKSDGNIVNMKQNDRLEKNEDFFQGKQLLNTFTIFFRTND